MKLADFKLATLKEIIDANYPPGLANNVMGGGIILGSPGDLHKTYVYATMHNQFGPPYKDWKMEYSNWGWILKIDEGLLSVYDFKGRWSIGYIGNIQRINQSLYNKSEGLKKAIISEVAQYCSKKEIAKNKVGGIIVNPFALFSRTAEDLITQAKKTITEINIRKAPHHNLWVTFGSGSCPSV